MTQEQLDTLIEVWCLTAQESLGDYDLTLYAWTETTCTIGIRHKEINYIGLPYEYIRDNYTSKTKAKIIIGLLEQIVENGDQWLQDEADYHSDKLAEKWDNGRKSNLEND